MMKKSIVAAAAMAATASFAQVVIEGSLDMGLIAKTAPMTTAGKTEGTILFKGNGSSTSSIRFKGNEDLGGGMRAGFWLEFNPDLSDSSTLDNSSSFANTYNGTPFNGEQFVSLAGNFGEVKLGTVNAGFYKTAMMASPLGTAIGSGYSGSGFARLGTVAMGIQSGTNSGTSRIIRHEKMFSYATPVTNGFSAQFDYANGNDNSATSTTNNDTYAGLALNFSSGDLNMSYALANQKFGTNSLASMSKIATSSTTACNTVTLVCTTTTTLVSDTIAAGWLGTDITYGMLAANYKIGETTVYGGYTSTKHSAATPLEDATSTSLAAKYEMSPSIDLFANYVSRTSNLSTVNNAKLIGFGFDYKLSKRTVAYGRYETYDVNTDGKAAVAGGSVTSQGGFGIRHAF